MSTSDAKAGASLAPLWLCAAAAVLSLLGLLGHALDVELLDGFWSGHSRMQPSSALLMLLAALGIALRHTPRIGPVRWASSVVLGLVILLFSTMVVVEYAAHVRLPIDWHFAPSPSSFPHPGRPSPLTAVALAALGAGLLVFDVEVPRFAAPREWMFLAAMFMAFLSLVGHVFGAGPLYEVDASPVIGVALPTGLAISAVGLAGLLERKERGLMRLVTSRGPGGLLLRRVGLTVGLVGPALGAVVLVLVEVIGRVELPLVLALGSVSAVFLAQLLLAATAVRLERAHEAVETSRAQVQELLEQAPEGIFIADLTGRYTQVNAAGCRLLGYSPAELVGKSIVDLLRPEDVERLWRSRDALLRGDVEIAEWQLRRKDGSFVSVEVTAKILPDGRWQGFVRDISERLELERNLLESRDFLKQVLESSTEYGIIAEDVERRILLWNEGARRIYDYELSEISGAPSDRLVAPPEVDHWAGLHARGMAEGTAEGTVLAQRKNGTTFAARVVCTRRLGPANSTAGVLSVVRDLTAEQRHLHEQEFLARVGVELASCLEYGETLTRVLQLATAFLGDLAAIDVVRDGVVERARVLHRSPAGSEVAQAVAQLGAARAMGHPLWSVLETRRPLLLTHISDEARARFATSSEHARVLGEVRATSAMLVPLIARGQLLAVLSIAACNDSRRYGTADMRVAEELARRAALALDNVELFQQSRLQAAMTTNLAEGVVLIRASDWSIAYANPRFEAMFGYGSRELLGQPVSVLNAGEGKEAEARAAGIIEHLERTGNWHGEIENVRKDGSKVWCAASVSTFAHEQYGKVWIAVHTDITERKHLEEKNARSLLEKEVLLKEIHHRVKNNLQVITSLFSLQRSRTQSEELKSLLDESRTRVQSIALVHEQLYRSAELAIIDLDDYLRNLLSALGSSYGAGLVTIEASAKDVVLDVEEAVPCALIVCELVSNSFKHAFASGAGKVSVRARQDEQGLCVLEVADNGCGMPADFDWQKASSLGLRLVRTLTRQLRGSVELDRSHGTRFTVRFRLRHGGMLAPRDGGTIELASTAGP